MTLCGVQGKVKRSFVAFIWLFVTLPFFGVRLFATLPPNHEAQSTWRNPTMLPAYSHQKLTVLGIKPSCASSRTCYLNANALRHSK